MGASEEVMAHNSYDEDVHGVVKGKRTKRRRTHRLSSPAVTTVLSISSAEDSGSTTEEEEEDLANCLILLAQGRGLDTSSHGDGEDEKFSGQKTMEAATNGKEDQNASNYVYTCRTCNKCFSSFQALGGHRTSHKRPKTAPVAPATMAATERTKAAAADEYDLKMSVASYPDTSGSGTVAAGKLRSHECSICGLEFSSGQALGGHMRRHRPAMLPVFSQEVKKEKNVFALDLNLPAPSDDEDESSSSTTAFPFVGKRPLHFPALVDCLY